MKINISDSQCLTFSSAGTIHVAASQHDIWILLKPVRDGEEVNKREGGPKIKTALFYKLVK